MAERSSYIFIFMVLPANHQVDLPPWKCQRKSCHNAWSMKIFNISKIEIAKILYHSCITHDRRAIRG